VKGDSKLVAGLARLGVTAVTVLMLAVPTATYVYVKHRVQLGAQVPPVRLDPLSPELASEFAKTAGSPSRSFLVLGYHDLVNGDVEPAGDGVRRVSVSAGVFATHLRMLTTAGYHSISAEQAAAFVNRGAPLPERSVLIAFDGARPRDWSHADPILAEFGFRATIFIDPTLVREKRGLSLSWLALRRMVQSGRWSVGVAGTQQSVSTDANGGRASALLAHRWLDQQGRTETAEEFQARIKAMLEAARHAIVDAGLPDPRLFSFPFQAGYPLDAVATTFAELSGTVVASFAAGVLTWRPDEAVNSSWVQRRVLPRMEIYGSTTDQVLHARIRDASAL
jgi:biofilm PGA synthesis lipoprotein PgaB